MIVLGFYLMQRTDCTAYILQPQRIKNKAHRTERRMGRHMAFPAPCIIESHGICRAMWPRRDVFALYNNTSQPACLARALTDLHTSHNSPSRMHLEYQRSENSAHAPRHIKAEGCNAGMHPSYFCILTPGVACCCPSERCLGTCWAIPATCSCMNSDPPHWPLGSAGRAKWVYPVYPGSTPKWNTFLTFLLVAQGGGYILGFRDWGRWGEGGRLESYQSLLAPAQCAVCWLE